VIIDEREIERADKLVILSIAPNRESDRSENYRIEKRICFLTIFRNACVKSAPVRARARRFGNDHGEISIVARFLFAQILPCARACAIIDFLIQFILLVLAPCRRCKFYGSDPTSILDPPVESARGTSVKAASNVNRKCKNNRLHNDL